MADRRTVPSAPSRSASPGSPPSTASRPSQRIEVLYWLHEARRDLVRQSPGNDSKAHGSLRLALADSPNPIGVSLVRLVAREGSTLSVRGLDLPGWYAAPRPEAGGAAFTPCPNLAATFDACVPPAMEVEIRFPGAGVGDLPMSERLRLLFCDHLNLARGKYLPAGKIGDGSSRFCRGVFAIGYRQGSPCSPGLPDARGSAGYGGGLPGRRYPGRLGAGIPRSSWPIWRSPAAQLCRFAGGAC